MRAICAASFLISALFTVAVSAAQTFVVAQPRIGAAPQQRQAARVAASNEQFLVAWHDGRESTSGRGRAFAARVSRAGVLLDPTGIPVGDEVAYYGPGSLFSVASNGTDFLLATRTGEGNVQLTKISRDGVVEAGAVLDIVPYYANLVSLGDGYALFYNENISSDFIVLSNRGKVIVLDRDGRVTRASVDIVASSSEVWDLDAAVSGDGENMLLVWKDNGDGRVHARPMTATALRGGDVTFNSDLGTPATVAVHGLDVVGGGDRYFVSWIEGQEYRARVISTAGAVVGSIIQVGSTQVPTDIDVAWNGSRFVATYATVETGSRMFRTAEFTPNGIRTNDVGPSRSVLFDVAIAAVGSDSLIAWATPSAISSTGAHRINADLFDVASAFKFGGDGLHVSRSASLRTEPEGVWRGSHYLAAWREESDTLRVAMGRFTPNGTPLDGEGILLGSAGASAPSVATDGHDALVAWSQHDGAYVAHVSASGVVTPRQFSASPFTPNAQVVWNGEDYAACAGTTLVRLGTDGATKQVATIPNAGANECKLSWSGSQYLVVWTTTEICFPVCIPPRSLFALAVSEDFAPLGGAVRLATPHVASEPRLANAGDRTLLVWLENDRERSTLQARRISAGGTLLDAASFEIGEASTLSDVFAEGENWIVTSGPYAWTVSRGGDVSARERRYPFVLERAQSNVIAGGPAPLMLYQVSQAGLPAQLYARFLNSIRRRGVRH